MRSSGISDEAWRELRDNGRAISLLAIGLLADHERLFCRSTSFEELAVSPISLLLELSKRNKLK